MKTFQYTIREELGMHARPAGLILQLAKDCLLYTSDAADD